MAYSKTIKRTIKASKCKNTQKPRAMQIHLHWHVSSGGAVMPRTHGYDGRSRHSSLQTCIAEAWTVFLPKANIAEAESTVSCFMLPGWNCLWKLLEQPQIVKFTQNPVNQYIASVQVKSICYSRHAKTHLPEQLKIVNISQLTHYHHVTSQQIKSCCSSKFCFSE